MELENNLGNLIALLLLVFSFNLALAAQEPEKPVPPPSPNECKIFLESKRVSDPNFVPDDNIAKNAFAGGLRFFLVEIAPDHLKEFLTELANMESDRIPEFGKPHALIPITEKYRRNWLETPDFGTLNIFNPVEKEMYREQGAMPVIVNLKHNAYVIVDASILSDRPWVIYNMYSLRSGGKNIYDEMTHKTGYAEMRDNFENMTESHGDNETYRGRFVMDGPVLKRHMLGFLLPPGDPFLANPVKEVAKHLIDDRLVVIESKDLAEVFSYFRSPETQTTAKIQKPAAPKRSSFLRH